MDSISRKEVISQIEFCLADFTDYKLALEDTLERVKNTRSAFDGMTNGEVIQAVFPYIEVGDTPHTRLIRTDLDGGSVPLIRDWWDAPYKAERGDQAE